MNMVNCHECGRLVPVFATARPDPVDGIPRTPREMRYAVWEDIHVCKARLRGMEILQKLTKIAEAVQS